MICVVMCSTLIYDHVNIYLLKDLQAGFQLQVINQPGGSLLSTRLKVQFLSIIFIMLHYTVHTTTNCIYYILVGSERTMYHKTPWWGVSKWRNTEEHEQIVPSCQCDIREFVNINWTNVVSWPGSTGYMAQCLIAISLQQSPTWKGIRFL